jgi:transposase
MWPGNTADVTTLIPVIERIRNRFHVGRFCIVADRGMISADTVRKLEDPQRDIAYIFGTRMRKVNEIKRHVLSRQGRYREVYPEGKTSKDPAPLKVKEVLRSKRSSLMALATSSALIPNRHEKMLKTGKLSLSL